jgi:SAM-dependent methyltransferase
LTAPIFDNAFTGPVSKIYETHLVPMIFAPYAADLARRVAARQPASVLELACGTGAVTRVLAEALPASASYVATDLSPAMLEEAKSIVTRRPIEWREADAQALPLPDASADAIVCQFGVMFFPDKPKAFAEARRVLTRGGALLFSVWDKMEANEFGDVVTQEMAKVFPDDPPNFLPRTPHGYNDVETIRRDLAAGGLTRPASIETVTFVSRAPSARHVALAYCQGTSLRAEIEARDPAGPGRATDAAERALTRRFGTGPIEGKLQALVVTAPAS